MRERHNRHLPLGTKLTDMDEGTVSHKFLSQTVLLTGDPGTLNTPAGRLMLLVSANLIARFCPRIDLAVPGTAGSEALALLNRIDRSENARFRLADQREPSEYAAALSIGRRPKAGVPFVVINSVGWQAIMGERDIASQNADDRNPFGALMAAALGAAEVFKGLLRPHKDKASFFGESSFSVFDYSTGGISPGPRLPDEIRLPNSFLAGVGAVGNAFLLSLSNVPGIQGELTVVDRQSLDDPTNLNRYLLAFEDDINPTRPMPKVNLASRLFENSQYRIQGVTAELEDALNQIYSGKLKRPRVVLSALDNNEGRGSLQKLWPSLLIEGATDETTSQVSRHEYEKGLACLMCIHSSTTPGTSPYSYTQDLAGRSGMTPERIASAMHDDAATVTEKDVQEARSEQKEFLNRNLGRKICSVLSDVEQLATRPKAELPIQPSVSFVSMTSGILLAAEYIKYAAGIGTSLETLFQMDLMFPLANSFLQPVEKVKSCYCVQRSTGIASFRRAMGEF